jgi:hypothetical protein
MGTKHGQFGCNIWLFAFKSNLGLHFVRGLLTLTFYICLPECESNVNVLGGVHSGFGSVRCALFRYEHSKMIRGMSPRHAWRRRPKLLLDWEQQVKL